MVFHPFDNAAALKEAGIPFVPAVGAMSVWMDLRGGLAEPTWQAERALWDAMVDDHKLILTPGAPPQLCSLSPHAIFQ